MAVPKIVSLLVGRRSVAFQLALFLLALLVTTVIPQRPLPLPSAIEARPFLAVIVRVCALDHVYGSFWFVILAVVFTATLFFSCLEQYRYCRRILRGVFPRSLPTEEATVGLDRALAVFRRHGYAIVGRDEEERYCLAAGRWSVYGGLILHGGILLAAFFSLVYSFTMCRVAVRAVTGGLRPVAEIASAESRGAWPRSGDLPDLLGIKDLTPQYYDNGQLMMLGSEVLAAKGGGAVESYPVAVSSKGMRGALKIYQTSAFGSWFSVSVDGTKWRDLYMIPPESHGGFSYLPERLPLGQFQVRAKFHPGPGAPRLGLGQAALTLRLMNGDQVVGEGTIRKGEMAAIGPFVFTLDDFGWWTDLLLEASYGTYGIFLGFMMMIAGGVLGYFTTLREAWLWTENGVTRYSWKAHRFADFYRDEAESLRKALHEERS